jgi:hypothetical protein
MHIDAIGGLVPVFGVPVGMYYEDYAVASVTQATAQCPDGDEGTISQIVIEFRWEQYQRVSAAIPVWRVPNFGNRIFVPLTKDRTTLQGGGVVAFELDCCCKDRKIEMVSRTKPFDTINSRP